MGDNNSWGSPDYAAHALDEIKKLRKELLEIELQKAQLLCYDRDEKDLYAFRTHCWYSFEEQTRSMAKLLDYNFEWVLAGHGDRIKLPVDQMQTRLKALIERMQKS